jgi:hypothetical protein
MGHYTTALTFYEEALDIEKRVSHLDDYRLAIVYYNMSKVYDYLNQCDIAVKYTELTVQSSGKSLSSNNHDFVVLKNYFEQLQTKLR